MADLYQVSSPLKQLAADAPEGAKKRAERDSRLLAEKKAAKEARSVAQKTRNAELAQRTLAFQAAYEENRKNELAKIRAAKAEGSFFKPAEPKVLLVVRIKGVNKLNPTVRKVFQLFRLYQIHNAAFIKVNDATLKMLKHIEPFVAYGYPSLHTVRELIYKRGYIRCGGDCVASKQRIRIQDNDLISAKLGSLGVHGIEDIVEQIYTCGPAFKEVNNFLWTFKLKSPKGGYICKRHGFAEFRKGDWGNREEQIGKFVSRMM